MVAPTVTDRAVYIPVEISVPALRRQVLQVARLIEGQRGEEARALAARLQLGAERAIQIVQQEAPIGDGEASAEPAPPAREPAPAWEIRAAVIARTLLDLHLAGWCVSIEDGQIYVAAPSFRREGTTAEAKGYVRSTMQARVREQVEQPHTARLADRVEPLIHRVIADGSALAQALQARGPSAIQPVLEPARVQDGEEPTTGLPRYDLFRYLRFLWNFPYSDTPGRTLPFLVRDAGQPGSPVCGLLCFSSPLLRLTSRDDELGLTPAWLEAMAVGLDLPEGGSDPRARLIAHIEALCSALRLRRAIEETGISEARALADLALLLELPAPTDGRAVARALAALSAEERSRRQRQACQRILCQLRDGLIAAMEQIDCAELGVSLPDALSRPRDALPLLEEQAAATTQRFRRSRMAQAEHDEADTDDKEHLPSAKEEIDCAEPGGSLFVVPSRPLGASTGEQAAAPRRSLAAKPALDEEHGDDRDHMLFAKKRANQFLILVKGWAELLPLAEALARGDDPVTLLREATSRRRQPWLDADRPPLTGGDGMNRGLTEALLQRKVQLAATRIVDISVCGAIPPYNDLLGGKLAALAALSREAAAAYFEAYDGRASDIQSQMAKAAVRRDANLVALTTTSFYAVGSSQYSRLSLPPALGGLRWVEVGSSKGHGTLHFSADTVRLIGALLRAETGMHLITSTFGEGPSERLRKLRDGFALLRLPADELLRHGMARLIFVAALTPATRPGVQAPAGSHHTNGPTLASITAFWQERWLAHRIQDPGRLEALAAFDPSSVLLSSRFPAEVAVARSRAAEAAAALATARPKKEGHGRRGAKTQHTGPDEWLLGQLISAPKL